MTSGLLDNAALKALYNRKETSTIPNMNNILFFQAHPIFPNDKVCVSSMSATHCPCVLTKLSSAQLMQCEATNGDPREAVLS